MRTSIRSFAAVTAIALASPAIAQQQYMDAEFNAQWGLAAIGAQYALARGLTGVGIGVVVVDTAFDTTHPEFNLPDDRVGSFQYNPASYAVDDHGTHVAGIIGAGRNGFGMEGVAPDVILSSLALLAPNDSGSLDDAQLAQGYREAVAQGLLIFNNSWWHRGTQITNFTRAEAIAEVGPESVEAFIEAVDAGAALIFITGNDHNPQPDVVGGLPYLVPELARGWISVTSVDQNINRSSFANACGVAKYFCMAAPGTDIYSTMPQDPQQPGVPQYGVMSGTSMAAPHVTGAVAIAKQMFPNAQGAQLASLVLHTATDIGAPGIDAIYGWGLLSVQNLVESLDPDDDDDDGDDNGAVFVNATFSRFAAVDTMVTTLWDRSAQRILQQGGATAPVSVAQAMASAQQVPPMALGGPVRDDVDTSVMVSTGRSAAVWAQGLGAHASLEGTPTTSANLGGAIGGYDLFDDGTLSGGVAIAFTSSNLDTKGTGDESSAQGWHGFAYATWQQDNWFIDGIAGGNWFSNDYKRTTIGGTNGTVLGNAGIAGYSSNDTSGFAGRLTAGHVYGLGSRLVVPYAYAAWIHQRTGGSTETGADIFSLDIDATSLDQMEGGVGVRGALGGIAWHAFNISPSVDLAYGRLGGDVALPVGFELLGTPLSANIADLGRDVLRVGAQLDVMRVDEMIGGFVAYDGRFQANAQNNTFSGGVLVRF